MRETDFRTISAELFLTPDSNNCYGLAIPGHGGSARVAGLNVQKLEVNTVEMYCTRDIHVCTGCASGDVGIDAIGRRADDLYFIR